MTFILANAGSLAVGALTGVVLAISGLAAAVAGASSLTPQEQTGKRIYLEGQSGGDAPIFARVGRSRVQVPAAALPCGGCHGPDGLGRAEGGVEPPDITWGNLTKLYGHRHPNGRAHQPFDESGFASAIWLGLDPAFHELDPTMPIYEMSDQDMAALIAYVKRLGSDLDPGLGQSVIRLGTLAPTAGPLKEIGDTIVATLRTYFEEINSNGGIFGRRIELVATERPASAVETLNALKRLAREEPVFARVADFTVGMESEIFDILERSGVPNVGPVTVFATSRPSDGRTFFVFSGIDEQARALVVYAAKTLQLVPAAVAAIQSGSPSDVESVIDAARREGRAHDWPELRSISLSDRRGDLASLVDELAGAGVEAVFYLGTNRDLIELAAAAARAEWKPYIFLSGPLNARAALALPPAFHGKILIAYPNLPSDRQPSGIEDLHRLGAMQGGPSDHLAVQIAALVAAKVVVEGLRRSGRDLTRAKLIAALESLSRFETGLAPSVSFGPSRRMGAHGAYILSVDLDRRTFGSDATWVRVE